MPKLTDIASITIGKQPVEIKQGFYEIRKNLPIPELSIAEKLRTTVSVGNESKIKGFINPIESKGTFASWRSNLEREPVLDLYESQPLNTIKNTDQQDIQAFMLDRKHKEWLEEVDARMRKLGFKP